jgi:hypothetical protein
MRIYAKIRAFNRTTPETRKIHLANIACALDKNHDFAVSTPECLIMHDIASTRTLGLGDHTQTTVRDKPSRVACYLQRGVLTKSNAVLHKRFEKKDGPQDESWDIGVALLTERLRGVDTDNYIKPLRFPCLCPCAQMLTHDEIKVFTRWFLQAVGFIPYDDTITSMNIFCYNTPGSHPVEYRMKFMTKEKLAELPELLVCSYNNIMCRRGKEKDIIEHELRTFGVSLDMLRGALLGNSVHREHPVFKNARCQAGTLIKEYCITDYEIDKPDAIQDVYYACVEKQSIENGVTGILGLKMLMNNVNDYLEAVWCRGNQIHPCTMANKVRALNACYEEE